MSNLDKLTEKSYGCRDCLYSQWLEFGRVKKSGIGYRCKVRHIIIDISNDRFKHHSVREGFVNIRCLDYKETYPSKMYD